MVLTQAGKYRLFKVAAYMTQVQYAKMRGRATALFPNKSHIVEVIIIEGAYPGPI